jgi:hypothetical protein
MTQTRAAAVLGCKQAKISKIEKTGAIARYELEKLLDAYDIPETDAAEFIELHSVSENTRQPKGAAPKVDAYTQLLDLEPKAIEIRCSHGERIPAPLQSELYLSKWADLAHPRNRKLVPWHLANRKKRIERLFDSEEGPTYRVILSESCLHRLPGGYTAALDMDQTGYLLGLTEHSRLELRFALFTAPHHGFEGDFTVLSFEDPEQDFLYIEYPGNARVYRSAGELGACRQEWDKLRKVALSTSDTKKFLAERYERLREELIGTDG